MSVFFAVVPRGSQSETFADPDDAILDGLNRLLGPKYRADPLVVSPATKSGGFVACWDGHGRKKRGISARKGLWVASSMPALAEPIRLGISGGMGHLSIKNVLRGPYAAIWGNKGADRLLAWSTPPAIEPIFYAVTDEHVFISNRLILVGFAKNKGDLRQLEMDDEFLIEYLSYGHSISDKTPISGVQMLNPRTCLSVWNGNVKIIEAPELDPVEISETEDPRMHGVSELLSALRDSTSFLAETQPNKPVQLRLSGGKDSRLVLGLMREKPELKVTAVTQGDEDSEQVKVAAEIAELAGVPLVVKAPNMTDPESIIASCERTIFESGGLLPSEPTIAPFSAADPLGTNEYLAAGEWPLFKGYLERTSDRSMDSVNALIRNGSFDGVLNRDSEVLIDRKLDEWKASIPLLSSYGLLYMYGRDIRAARYQHAKTAQIDSRSTIFYPFLDAEVVRVSDALSSVNRLNQYSMFAVMKEVWPESFDIPFSGQKLFRFEYRESLANFSNGFQQAHTRSTKPFSGTILQYSQRPNAVDSVFYRSPITAASNFVVTSGFWPYFKNVLEPDFAANVEQWAKTDSDDQLQHIGNTRAEKKRTKIKVWRILMLVLWMGGRWTSLRFEK